MSWIRLPEKAYRSIIVIKGETRPEAQAAAVMSDMTRHGKFSVLQLAVLRERDVVGFEADRGRMTFGGGSYWGWSLIDPWRPLPSRLRVITCKRPVRPCYAPFYLLRWEMLLKMIVRSVEIVSQVRHEILASKTRVS